MKFFGFVLSLLIVSVVAFGDGTYVGNFVEDATVKVEFHTNQTDGAPVAPSSAFEAADFKIYKDGGTTEKTSTNGLTLSSPFDTIVGYHVLLIDTSNDTGDGGFWVTGSSYSVVLDPDETVDSIAVRATVATFGIEDRFERGTDSALLAASAPTNFGATVISAGGIVDANAQSATATFVQDMFTVDSTEVSGGEVTGSLVLETAKVVWDRVLTGATHNITSSAGRRLRQSGQIVFEDGTAQAGSTANSIVLASGDVTVDDEFNRAKVLIVGGTGQGQEGIITDSVASTDTLTITPAWPIATPDATSTYEIHPAQAHATVRNGGYDGGFVFVDTVNGAAGTEKGVNGTSTNPSSNLTDAYIIGTNETIISFKITPGSSVTLPADSTFRMFDGSSYSVALNGSDIEGSSFRGATISGTATGNGNTNQPQFLRCAIEVSTLPPCNGYQCGFAGTLTFGAAGDYAFVSCGSLLFGASPTLFTASNTIDFGVGIGASQLFLNDWAGGTVSIGNAGDGAGTDEMEMTGMGSLVINASVTATTEIVLRGDISFTDLSGGAFTLTDQTSNITILRDDLDIITGTNGVFIDDDAITAAKIAADAIGASELAANAIGASEIATDAIGAAEIAADAIGASEMATDAIGAAQLAADAVTEIVVGILAGVIDGSVDLETALKQMLSVMVNNNTVTGTSPFVYSYKNAAGSSEVVSQSIVSDGTARTTTIP